MVAIKNMELKVTFDVNQIRSRANWYFHEVGNSADCDDGWHNNIQFLPGQQFGIRLVATNYYKTTLQSVSVVDCCLITQPQIQVCGPGHPPQYAPPSPFCTASLKPLGALAVIPATGFSRFEPIVPSSDYVLIWNDYLVVGPMVSHWDLSFYVTVCIDRGVGATPDYRVFYFDPESEVGNGMDPP